MFLTQVKSSRPAGRSEVLPSLQRSGTRLCHCQHMVSKVRLGYTKQPADWKEKGWVIYCRQVL